MSWEWMNVRLEMMCSAHWYTRGRYDGRIRLFGMRSIVASKGWLYIAALCSLTNEVKGGPDGLAKMGSPVQESRYLNLSIQCYRRHLCCVIEESHETMCGWASSICSLITVVFQQSEARGSSRHSASDESSGESR